MKINIFGKELDLHYSYRMHKIYEQVTGHAIDMFNITLADIEILFYSAVVATLQYNKVDVVLGYTDFCNWIDDNGGEKLIIDFTKWYQSAMQAQADLMGDEEPPKIEGEHDPNA